MIRPSASSWSRHQHRLPLTATVVRAVAIGTVLAVFAGCSADRDSAEEQTAPGSGVVPVGAGGYVTGLSFSDDGRTRMVRTDTFGGYRWDGRAWSLSTSASSLPSSVVRPGLGGGVQAVAVAPSNASVAYMAYDDSIFRSTDAGRRWQVVKHGVTTSPGDDFRTTNPRMVVDPDDPKVAYYGTQLDGLLATSDGGSTWSPAGDLPQALRVSADPDTGRTATVSDEAKGAIATGGVTAVAIDPSSNRMSDGRRTVLYAAVWGRGLYRTSDGGKSWASFGPRALASVGNLRVTAHGDVFVTAAGSLAKDGVDYDVWHGRGSQWSRVTPNRHASWQTLAVDPERPKNLAAMAPGGQLARSADAGVTWDFPERKQVSDGDVPWLAWSLKGTDYMSIGDLAFDPVEPGRLWLAEGTGVWYADLGRSEASVLWHSQSRGIEQLVPSDVIDPPGGRPILVAWDRPLFRSTDLGHYPRHYGPQNKFSSGWAADWSVDDPHYLVASVASHQYPSDPHDSGYSTDGGKSWHVFPSVPQGSTDAYGTFGFGSVAVGAPGHVVWAPAFGKAPYVTGDGGGSWTQVQLPGLRDYSLVDRQPYYINRRILASDKSRKDTFYLYVQDTGVYRSRDGGRRWSRVSDNTPFEGLDMSYDVSLKAVPDRTGDLFMTSGQLTGDRGAAFAHSTDGGSTWKRVRHLAGVSAFGFGAPLPGREMATAYAVGYLDGQYGVYYSDDDGQSWRRAPVTYPAGKTARIVAIDGDKDAAGLVYLAVAGAGWAYIQLPRAAGD